MDNKNHVVWAVWTVCLMVVLLAVIAPAYDSQCVVSGTEETYVCPRDTDPPSRTACCNEQMCCELTDKASDSSEGGGKSGGNSESGEHPNGDDDGATPDKDHDGDDHDEDDDEDDDDDHTAAIVISVLAGVTVVTSIAAFLMYRRYTKSAVGHACSRPNVPVAAALPKKDAVPSNSVSVVLYDNMFTADTKAAFAESAPPAYTSEDARRVVVGAGMPAANMAAPPKYEEPPTYQEK